MKTEMDTSLASRRTAYDRVHELCRATNMRICKKPWAESDWSPYQSAVALAILGLVPAANSSDSILTMHGRWTMELSVVTASINDVMNEMPEISNPGLEQVMQDPTDRKDLH